MNRAFYSSTISEFLNSSDEQIIGVLARNNQFAREQTQRDAWIEEIEILKIVFGNNGFDGAIYLEFSIPRMGERIDAVLLIGAVVFVLEFKVGEKEFTSFAIDQVVDYALDLKNFHETSHEQLIAPILIATDAKASYTTISLTPHNDKILYPIRCNVDLLSDVINNVLNFSDGEKIEKVTWESGHYKPTPTIIEAARALYFGHTVEEISRNDAEAINISKTSEEIYKIIEISRDQKRKSICFVTGVPGAGKTLVGLNIANKYSDEKNELYSVFLSGNGPLVKILREALTRDKVKRDKEVGIKTIIPTEVIISRYKKIDITVFIIITPSGTFFIICISNNNTSSNRCKCSVIIIRIQPVYAVITTNEHIKITIVIVITPGTAACPK